MEEFVRARILVRWALFEPIDAASVVAFRVGFGLVMLADAIFHLLSQPLDMMYVKPTFMFRYFGFEWVPLIGENIHALYVLIAIASVGLILGFLYRLSALVVFIGTAWIFLQDQALYLNHMYMLILFAALLVFIPANKYWSLDSRIRPKIWSDTLPSWCRLILIIQIEIILIYAGLAKIDADWLHLEPLKTWLSYRADMPFFGNLFLQKWAVAVAAYGVIVLHLVGAPLLLVKTIRLYVLAIYACFHLLNHFVFDIGIFPWVTLFATLICFDSDWPRQFRSWMRRKKYKGPRLGLANRYSRRSEVWITISVSVWLAYQVLMPVRNVLYEGNVAWNEKGHRFSWRMKLRNKSGIINFYVVNSITNESVHIDIVDRVLSPRQRLVMPCKPDMVLQFAHFIKEGVAHQVFDDPDAGVVARGLCSLNFRRPAELVDSQVNLAARQRTLGGDDWILPLRVPLNDRWRDGAAPKVRH